MVENNIKNCCVLTVFAATLIMGSFTRHKSITISRSFSSRRFYKLDVRESLHHSTVLTVKTQQDTTVYQNFIIRYFK
jgi:hypothetical protein